MSHETWAAYVAKFTSKLALRVFLNGTYPGLGALVDFTEAALDFSVGNMRGVCINTICGFAELVSFGMWNTAKDALRKRVKDVFYKAGNKMFGEQAMKEMGEQVVEEVLSASNRITFDRIEQTLAFSLISSGGHEVEKTIGEDLGRMVLEPVFNNILFGGVKQTAQSFPCEFLKKEAKRAASKEFCKYSSRKFAMDLRFSLVKGAINSSYMMDRDSYDIPYQEREHSQWMSLDDYLSEIQSDYIPLKSDDYRIIDCLYRSMITE